MSLCFVNMTRAPARTGAQGRASRGKRRGGGRARRLRRRRRGRRRGFRRSRPAGCRAQAVYRRQQHARGLRRQAAGARRAGCHRVRLHAHRPQRRRFRKGTLCHVVRAGSGRKADGGNRGQQGAAQGLPRVHRRGADWRADGDGAPDRQGTCMSAVKNITLESRTSRTRKASRRLANIFTNKLSVVVVVALAAPRRWTWGVGFRV